MSEITKITATNNFNTAVSYFPEDVEPLFKAIFDNHLAHFSNLISQIDINSYYQDDCNGETLISKAILDTCLMFGAESFIKEVLSLQPNPDLAISSDDDAYSLKTWLQEKKLSVEEDIAEAEEDHDPFALAFYQAALSKINMVMNDLGI